MEFEKQKPITDDYRKGWERIYSHWPVAVCVQEKDCSCLVGTMHHSSCPADKRIRDVMADRSYRNGCPILSEGL
jgi:hypothetical protein